MVFAYRWTLAWVPAALAFALPGCVAHEDEAASETSAEIQRGTRESGRVPIVSYGFVCTATFVSRARCLITADHCSGGAILMGPDTNVPLSDPSLKSTFSRRSLSLRQFTSPPRYAGGSFDWSPADDVKIVWAGATPTPGPRSIDHARDYVPAPLDFSDAGGSDAYTVHGYGFDVCDETGEGVLRFGTFRGNGWSNATGAAVPGVRAANARTLLRIAGDATSGGRYGICAGDSGASVRSSAGVRGVIGWSLNGSNEGLATTLGAYRPWFERNVVGPSARFCNPNWPLAVRGPGAIDLSASGGVVVRHRLTGQDVDPWDIQATEAEAVSGLDATSGVRVRVRGADPLAPAHVRIVAGSDRVRWTEGRCAEATAENPGNDGSEVCTVTLDPTTEELADVSFRAL